MCGISGFICFSKNLTSSKLKKEALSMANSLSKRGPDSFGVWTDVTNGLALSHRRLSIIDLSSNANQPMMSKSKRFVIVYNGEVYNFKTLRKIIQQNGVVLKSLSDTEVILELISLYGFNDAIKKLNGIFSLAVWDRKNKKLFLARDRVGIKPLYIYNDNQNFAFASEIKAIKKLSFSSLSIDRESLSTYVRLNYIPSPFSIFKSVSKLEPGSIFIIDLKKNIQKKKFWNVEDLEKKTKNSNPEDTFHVLNNAVKNQMVSDVPLGVFLSGGIDSSLIAALAQKNSKKKISSFTIGFNESEFDEAKYARAISKQLGMNHNEVYFDYSELNNLVELIPDIYDEPFADSSQLPTFLLSQITKKNVTVALSGDGGDELFGGYYRYFLAEKYQRYIFSQPYLLKTIIKNIIKIFPTTFWNNFGCILPNSMGGRQFGDKLLKLSNLLDNSDETAFQKRIISNCSDLSNYLHLDKEKNVKYHDCDYELLYSDIVRRMQVLDFLIYLPDDILTKVDRASMYNSLEVRVPFLDNTVIEHAFRMEKKHYIQKSNGKVILKKVLKKFLPNQMIDRPKMGFGIPLGKLLIDSFSEKIEYYLNSTKIEKQKIFRTDFYKKLWLEHKSKKRNWQFLLWNFLVFQIWYDYWED